MLAKLEKEIGVKFKDQILLQTAFVHRSFLNEKKDKELVHNERLEFLGDAVLELAATKFLYSRFPDTPEGKMTAYRSALVNTESLSRQAQRLNLGDFLSLSKGERACLKGRGHILANTFEALVGAIYLDQGMESVEKFLEEQLFGYLDEVLENNLHRDAKSHFQEQAQEEAQVTPHYELVEQQGPDHDRKFVMGVYLGGELVTTGKGSSKQKAEVEAAKKALEIKKWL